MRWEVPSLHNRVPEDISFCNLNGIFPSLLTNSKLLDTLYLQGNYLTSLVPDFHLQRNNGSLLFSIKFARVDSPQMDFPPLLYPIKRFEIDYVHNLSLFLHVILSGHHRHLARHLILKYNLMTVFSLKPTQV